MPVRRAMSLEPTRRRRALPEVEGYKEEPDKSPSFTFPLRDRFLQEGVGVKLICTVAAKPTPVVSCMGFDY